MAGAEKYPSEVSIPEVSEIIFTGPDGYHPSLEIDPDEWREFGVAQSALMRQILALAGRAQREHLEPETVAKLTALFTIGSIDRELKLEENDASFRELMTEAGAEDFDAESLTEPEHPPLEAA